MSAADEHGNHCRGVAVIAPAMSRPVLHDGVACPQRDRYALVQFKNDLAREHHFEIDSWRGVHARRVRLEVLGEAGQFRLELDEGRGIGRCRDSVFTRPTASRRQREEPEAEAANRFSRPPNSCVQLLFGRHSGD